MGSAAVPRHSTRLLAIVLVVTVFSVFGVPGVASAAVLSLTGNGLTSDTAEQYNPDIWNGFVAWAHDTGAGTDIRGYDRTTSTPITIASQTDSQARPAVSDDYVVYGDHSDGDWDIRAYNRETAATENICTAALDQDYPAIYERYIVWMDFRSGNYDIWGYDLALDTEFPICVAAGAQTHPVIWGDVVAWVDYRNDPAGGDIWMYDISTGADPIAVAQGPHDQWEPDICQEWIVYTEYLDATYQQQVYGYNMSLERSYPLGGSSARDSAPSIDGDWVMYENTSLDTGDIDYFDAIVPTGSKGLYPLENRVFSPVIQGGQTAWLYDAGADNEVIAGTVVWTHDGERLEGANRYETCAAIAKRGFTYGSSSVIIATGENFPDALGAAALAGLKNMPILLTPKNSLHPATQQALVDLNVYDTVYVIGSDKAVSASCAAQIEAAVPGDGNVVRIEGGDRYATANAIANAVAVTPGGLDEAYGFVATGVNYPDALAASAVAYAFDIPIYLCAGTSITDATLNTMEANGVTKPIIVGGEPAVSAAVEARLNTRFGASNVDRVWGNNRYLTSVEIARYAQDKFDIGATGMCLATGTSFPDALAAGPLAGSRYAPILLTNGTALSPDTGAYLTEYREEIRYLTVLGSTAAISENVKDAADDRLK